MISIRLQIALLGGVLGFVWLLVHYLIQKKLHLKYCLVWILAVLAMLISIVFPKFIKWLAELMGIQTSSNFIFVVFGLFMLLIVFTLTAIVSHMNMRIFRLVQNQALLEKRLREVEYLQKPYAEK